MQSGARLSKPTPKPKEEEIEVPVQAPLKEEVEIVEPEVVKEEMKVDVAEPEVKLPREPKEKFVISQLPPIAEDVVLEPEVKEEPAVIEVKLPELKEEPPQLAPELPQIEVEPEERMEVALPVLTDIREEITAPVKPRMEKSFKVNFSLPRISAPKFKTPSPESSNRIMMTAIALVVVGIVGAITGLLYIESQPSTGKALSAVRETLANAQTLNFTLNAGFDLISTPSDEDILAGSRQIEIVMVYEATGKYDKVAREMEIDGNFKSIGEELAYKQTIITNDVYIKYEGRDYIQSSNLDDAILTIQDIESQNLFPKFTSGTTFGYGAEEVIGTQNSYRFRAYPSEEQLEEYIVNFVGSLIKKLYPLNPPIITAEDVTFTNSGYRVWVAVNTYQPTKVQMLFDQINIDLDDMGTIVIKDYQTDLLISSLNQAVVIEKPI